MDKSDENRYLSTASWGKTEETFEKICEMIRNKDITSIEQIYTYLQESLKVSNQDSIPKDIEVELL